MFVVVSFIIFVSEALAAARGACFESLCREEQKSKWKQRHDLVLQLRDDCLQRSTTWKNRISIEPAPFIVQEARYWMERAIQAQRRVQELEEEALDRQSVGCFQGFRAQSKYKRLMQSHLTLGRLLQERAWLMQEEWRRLYGE